MDCISGEQAACLFKWATREPHVVLLLHSAKVRVNEVRLLLLGALRHHSSDCLRQRPSVGGYSSQFALRAHPTRRLWRGRISWRCGDWEFGRSFSKSPKLQVSQQRKQQKAFVCLYRLSHLVILGNKVGNTTDPVLVMGENRGGYGCKACLYRVKGSWAMGVSS